MKMEIYAIKPKSEKYSLMATLGSVSAGEPLDAENSLERIDLNEFITDGQTDVYFIRASGDSMEAEIKSGDWLVVNRNLEPAAGNTVIASVNGDYTVKIYSPCRNGLRLVSANEKYAPRLMKRKDNCEIFGVVTHILHKCRRFFLFLVFYTRHIVSVMAIKKFYSNKAKAGWRANPNYKPCGTGKNPAKQSDDEKKFWSWGYDIRQENRKRRRDAGFGSKQLAENAVSRIRINEKEGKYDLQTRKFPLVSEVLEKHKLRIEGKKEKGRATVIFNLWLSLLPPNLRFNEITTALIRLYEDEREKKVKASSVNREMTFIASAIHSAYVDFPELENFPLPRIPRPKVDKSRRERLVTQNEVMQLLTYLLSARQEDEKQVDFEKRQVVGQVFQMCLLTGSRIGEIARLRWEHIDFDAKILQIYGRKNRFKTTRTVRYLELNPTIEQILRARKRTNAFGEFVFCRTGNSITDYYKIMREASESNGITYGRWAQGGFVTHDARHTAVTRMLQAGVDLSTIGAITGHSDSNLILHYSHATRESRKAAVSVLENFVKGKAKKAS